MVFGQYFFSLKYHYFEKNKYLMYEMGWLGLFRCKEYTMPRVRSSYWTPEKLAGECTDPNSFP